MTIICEKTNIDVHSKYKSVALITINNPIIKKKLLEEFPDFFQRNNGRYPADECMSIDEHTIGVLIHDTHERLTELLDQYFSKDFDMRKLPPGTRGTIQFDTITSYERNSSERESIQKNYFMHVCRKNSRKK